MPGLKMRLNLESRAMEELWRDVEASIAESDYVAVNTLWLGLLKMANQEEGRSEKERMNVLIRHLSDHRIRQITASAAVDSLLDLEPPLETVLSNRWEELRKPRITEALQGIRKCREELPLKGLSNLLVILRSIRNKREHGFKTRNGLRDVEILRAARAVLNMLCQSLLDSNQS